MLSLVPGLPGETITRESTEIVAGFSIEYTERSIGGHATGSLWIYGPDTDDQIKVSRNTSLPKAMDFDFNGTVHTIDFDKLAAWINWGISTGDGDNRIEFTFAAGDAEQMAFEGFQVYGGAGNDVIINGDTPAALRGEGGNDVLRGGDADDSLEGG